MEVSQRIFRNTLRNCKKLSWLRSELRDIIQQKGQIAPELVAWWEFVGRGCRQCTPWLVEADHDAAEGQCLPRHAVRLFTVCLAANRGGRIGSLQPTPLRDRVRGSLGVGGRANWAASAIWWWPRWDIWRAGSAVWQHPAHHPFKAAQLFSSACQPRHHLF